MELEREAAIRDWWSRIDEEQRDELMWSNAGLVLSPDQVASMEEAGLTLAGRPRKYDLDLQFTLPADVAQFIAECT